MSGMSEQAQKKMASNVKQSSTKLKGAVSKINAANVIQRGGEIEEELKIPSKGYQQLVDESPRLDTDDRGEEESQLLKDEIIDESIF